MNKFILAALFAVAPALFGQSYTSVQATQVRNAFGGSLTSGQLCFISNTPITASGGAAGTSFCGPVSNGSLVGSLQVPNLATASPSGSSYTVQVVDFASASPTSVLWIPNVYSVTGPTFNFDSFTVPAGLLVTGYDIPRIACQSGSSYIQANAPNGSNRWSCLGGSWTQNVTGGSLPKGIFSLNGLTGTSQVFQNDANIGISSTSGVHILTWNGFLDKSRQNPATSYVDGTNVFTGNLLDASAVATTKPFTVMQGVPSGSCFNAASWAVNGLAANANLYECVGGSWQQLAVSSGVGGGTGTACANCTTSNYALPSLKLLAGDGNLGIRPVDLTGDVITNGSMATTLQSVNAAPGTYGDANHTIQMTVDTKGRVTSVSQILISGGSGTGSVTNSGGSLTLNRLIGGNGGSDIKSVDLSGDVSTSGSLATTLAVVNTNPGSYGDSTHNVQLTVDTKGRITSVGQVTSAGGTGGGISALTGDVAASGAGSVAATLATVNSTVGTFGDSTHAPRITVDAKGRVTAVSSVVVSGGTGGSSSTPVQAGTLAQIPTTCTSGDGYWASDAAPGQMLYTCMSQDNWVPFGFLGGSGALAYNGTTGALDINTSVIPRLSAANAFSGSNSFSGTTTLNNVVINGTCTGSCGTGSGSSFYTTVQANGTPATQRAKLNVAAGTGISVAATDNGSDTTTLTITNTGGGTGGTTVAANGPYLDIAGTHYLASHMVVPALWTNTGYSTGFGSAPTYSATTLAPTLSWSAQSNGFAYVKNLGSNSVLHVGATCTLMGQNSDSGCGVVVLTASNEGNVCYVKTIGNQGSTLFCAHITNGVVDTANPAGLVSLPYSASDLWLGWEGANVTGAGTPSFVMSGDGGRTWQPIVNFTWNLGSNPTKAGLYGAGTGTMQILSLDQH